MRAATLLLALLLLVPATRAAAPAPMTLAGRLVVNDAPAANGTLLSVFAGEDGPFAQAATDQGGNFSLVVPADDPATPQREGAADGDMLRFVVGGGAQPGPRFGAGSNLTLDLAFALPSLHVGIVDVAPAAPREGENVTLTLAIENRGAIAAQAIALSARATGRVVASSGTAGLQPGANRTVTFVLPTAGFGDTQTLVVAATASNGDADPAASRVSLTLHVAPDAAPTLASLAVTPAEPREGQNVTVEVQASDADGLAWVAIHWRAPDGDHEANLTAPPYRAELGGFPAGTALQVWASAKEAGPVGKVNETGRREVDVLAAEPAPPSNTPQKSPGAGVPAIAVALLASLMLRRAGTGKR